MPIANHIDLQGNPRMRRRVEESLTTTANACHGLAGNRAHVAPLRARYDATEREFAVAHAGGSGFNHVFWACALVLTGLIEVMISGPILEDLCRSTLTDTNPLTPVLVGVLPILIVVVELAIAMMAHHYNVNRAPGSSRHSVGHVLRWVALLFVCCCVLATRLARLPESDDSDALKHAFWIETIGFLAIALIVHTVILFCGARLEDAFTFFAASRRHRQASKSLNGNGASMVANRNLALQAFRDYRTRLEEYNRLFPANPIPPGPFDATTRQTLNEIHDHTVIAEPVRNPIEHGPDGPRALPPAAGDNPPAPRPVPPAGPGPDPAAETETERYYRNVADAFVRREEERVHPEA